jgi:hypothetical protein
MRPTLEELYALPEPMLDDNFDLHSIGGCDQLLISLPQFFIENDGFLHLHRTCLAAAWHETAEGRPNSLHLWFHDIQGDQGYLDAHAAFKSDLGYLTIQHYDMEGKAVRQTIFHDLKFAEANTAYDAAGGKVVMRFVTFHFGALHEIELKAD